MTTPTGSIRFRASLASIVVLVTLLGGACASPRPPSPTPEAAVPATAEDLHAAARAGDLAGVRAAIESGVAVDAPGFYGFTALLMASDKGHPEVVAYLLDAGADPTHRESFWGTHPLSAAIDGEHPEVVELLLAGGAEPREYVLEAAARSGDVELARVLTRTGPVNAEAAPQIALLVPEARDAFAAIESRPDPPPPEYDANDLARFLGSFETFEGDREVRAEFDVRDDGIGIAVDGDDPVALAAVAEDRFRSRDGVIDVQFWGRAGTVEGAQVTWSGMATASLRRSVADPVGAAAFRAAPEEAEAVGEAVMHWPQFRGPSASGIGDGADVPVAWDLESGEGVRWIADLPGLGNSSPVVWGDRVYVTTAVATGIEQDVRTGLTGAGDAVDEDVEHVWTVLAFDKSTGAQVWTTDIARAVPTTRRHFKASQASSTAATDGRRVCVVFPTAGLACLDSTDGTMLWRVDLGGLNAGAPNDPTMHWGFSSSPVLYGETVILQVDIHEGAYVAAWSAATGEPLWRVERPDVDPSWATPTIVSGEAGDELVLNGSVIHAYDPRNGDPLWSVGPNSAIAIATPIARGDVVYVSAGYPPIKPIYAVPIGLRGDHVVEAGSGSGPLVWSEGRGGAYMPTPLLYRGILYVVHHNGRLVTYDAATGDALYKARFSSGGTFTGSPVAVNGKIYAGTEEGTVYVFEAGTEYRELAVNEIGEPLMASPAISDGAILWRTPRRLIAVADR